MTPRSELLEYAAKTVYWLMLTVSAWILLRGHNAPGGGFIAGLVAVAATALIAIVYGVDQARRRLPLRPPGPGLFDSLYALPEFQPIYDFEEDHFSFWVGPEIGKMLSTKNVVYMKPGFGVQPDDDEGDREWTFEVGWRFFMD